MFKKYSKKYMYIICINELLLLLRAIVKGGIFGL
jgi:hypothetical protein